MAVVKGIKERVHLPLYDALAIRPGQQLREVESSSVLKFFVNVQGKTELETDMQASSLLPHWNTLEARALLNRTKVRGKDGYMVRDVQ